MLTRRLPSHEAAAKGPDGPAAARGRRRRTAARARFESDPAPSSGKEGTFGGVDENVRSRLGR
jgi:hypothetical protein